MVVCGPLVSLGTAVEHFVAVGFQVLGLHGDV